VSSSSKHTRLAGFTLVELLVTLVILSILASVALPYAEITVRREKEFELRRELREIRTAIDAFHEDWLAGRISRTDRAASDDGYPKTLEVLVAGVDRGQANGGKRRYLRSIPADPLQPAVVGAAPWALLGYQDDPDALNWGGKDVYDIHSLSEGTAVDGTMYRDW
jgi:general secretion pathway protein G